jgi:hypothetical protein
VDSCFGTRPSQAAKSRPWLKPLPVPMAATTALACPIQEDWRAGVAERDGVHSLGESERAEQSHLTAAAHTTLSPD